LYGKQVAVELIVRVLACLAEGLGMGPQPGSEVDPNTALHWLVEGRSNARFFMRALAGISL
jgi:hypothetical protein